MALLLRCEIDDRVTSVVRKRQHISKKCDFLDRRAGLRQYRIKFIKLRLGGVAVLQSSRAFHQADDWMKRAVGVLRRAEKTPTRVRLAGEAFHQRGCEP